MTRLGLPLDEEQVAAFVDRYAITSPSWHLLSRLDWREIFKMRRRQLAFLGRYGRQDVEHWRRVPIPILNEMTRELGEMVREENTPLENY